MKIKSLTFVTTVREIPRIIETLCKAPPGAQRAAIETYFTPTASFTHPFCRTGSFAGSIWLIIMIYRWYKILSPRIDVEIESVGMSMRAPFTHLLAPY